MAKMMTQLDISTKYVMDVGTKSVFIMGVEGVNSDEFHFEALSNEKVNFVVNQRGGYHTNYPIFGGNKGWNRYEG